MSILEEARQMQTDRMRHEQEKIQVEHRRRREEEKQQQAAARLQAREQQRDAVLQMLRQLKVVPGVWLEERQAWLAVARHLLYYAAS